MFYHLTNGLSRTCVAVSALSLNIVVFVTLVITHMIGSYRAELPSLKLMFVLPLAPVEVCLTAFAPHTIHFPCCGF